MKMCVGTQKEPSLAYTVVIIRYDKIMTVDCKIKNVSVQPCELIFGLNLLTKLFSPVNLKNERLRYVYLVPQIANVSSHTKQSTNNLCMTSQ